MKFKNICAAAGAALLLGLFLPVFYCLIMYGNNMNYNPAHKIYAIYGNKVLLLLTSLGVLAFFLVIYLVRKIPDNKYTIGGYVGLSMVGSIIFYIINVEICKCIAFYGGWDCGMVANSARWVYEGTGMGYDDYYTIFTNNVPITWLLHELYGFTIENPKYPYNPEFIWIQYQCLQHAVAVFFSGMTALVVSKRVFYGVLVFGVNCIFLGLSPWKMVPYTDASTIAFPVLLVFLYAVFWRMQSKWKYLVWLFMAFCGTFGGIMKATVYVTLIAIVAVDFVWVLFDKKWSAGKLSLLGGGRVVLLLLGFLLATGWKQEMYRVLDYEYNYDMDMGWIPFLYDGLKEETTGACSADGLTMVRDHAGLTRAERNAVEWQSVEARIKEKGMGGLLDFWLRKQVMTYNDGTFSWHQEGFFNAWEYEDITDSSWKQPLRDFYWLEGADYDKFVTWSHGIWLFMLIGVQLAAALLLIQAILNIRHREAGEEKSYRTNISIMLVVNFIGTFLFLTLFEGRARYLYNSIAVISTMAVMGYCQAWEMWTDLYKKYINTINNRRNQNDCTGN